MKPSHCHARLRFRLRWLLDRRRRAYYRRAPAGVLFSEFEGRIAAGPFAGMHYSDTASGSTLAPKLLGCYERELHPILAELLAKAPATFIDVGAAEGYYAVGIPFADQSRQLKSYAIDINPDALDQVRALARLNGVADRVETAASLGDALARRQPGRMLIICDVEGAEGSVLSPVTHPSLRNADLLVEIHEDASRVSTQSLLESIFRDTHEARWIAVQPRGIDDARHARWCRDHEFLTAAVNERRSRSVGWLVLEQK